MNRLCSNWGNFKEKKKDRKLNPALEIQTVSKYKKVSLIENINIANIRSAIRNKLSPSPH